MSLPAPGPAERIRIPREIWVLVAAAFVIAIGFGLITPVLPQFAQSFGVGATASSVVVSAFAFFRLVFAPVCGRLIAVLGERPVYLIGLLVVAVSTGATAFAGSYWQLLVFRGLGGIGSTMFTVSAVALLVRLAPASIRGRVASAYGSAFLLGGIGGPVVGGALGGLGLRVPFLVYAGALVLAAAVVAVFISGAALRPAPDAPTLPTLTPRAAWADSAYRAGMASGFANGWANFGVRNAILPLFAAAVIGKEPWVAGMALAVFAAGNAIGLTYAGRTSDRVGRRPFILGGLLVSGLATAVTGFANALPGARRGVGGRGRRGGDLEPGPAGRAGRRHRPRAQRWAGPGGVPDEHGHRDDHRAGRRRRPHRPRQLPVGVRVHRCGDAARDAAVATGARDPAAPDPLATTRIA